jgi:DNA-binding GntR family transcriptional regulator
MLMTGRTADRIRENLEQAILTGEFADGERLSELDLCRRFDVSRTPIREAFHQLSTAGLLELLPRRGAFVRYPGFVEVVEMFDVMGELEAMCGRLAAKRITDEQLDAFTEACLKCEQAEARGDRDDYYRENELFHQILYQASGNGFLQSQAVQLQKRLQAFRRLQLHVRGRIRQSLEEHRKILAAIEAGNETEAADTLRDHVIVQGEKFFDLMRGIGDDRLKRTG